MKLVSQIFVQLVDRRALFLGITTVVDAHLLIRVVKLPRLTLVLVVEIYDEEWVLEVDEEVPHVGHFLRLFLILDNVKRRISTFVVAINFIFQLFLCIATRDVFDAKVCSQFKPLFYEVNPDGLAVASLIVRLGMRACVLRAIGTLGSVGGPALVRVGRLREVEAMV